VPLLIALLRTRVTVIWLVLIGATLLSWWLGTDHGIGAGGDHRSAGVVILAVAFFKARLVGLYFMDLRGAPIVLRAVFEVYCLLVFGVVIGMFLTGASA
jgi:hypothetical protein